MRVRELNAIFFTIAVIATGCTTYYQKNLVYHQHIQAEDFKAAEKTIDHARILKRQRNNLLLLLEKGKLAHLQREYEQSNTYLNEADLLIEDYKKSVADYAVSLTVNPQLQVYSGEDFEKVLIHYYKALNYLYLGNRSAALVEARRINLKLHEINDQYKKVKNKYSRDAFAHNLMGIIYEADGDYNNAFIAYRNAVNLYLESTSQQYMNVEMPDQLQIDVIRMAKAMGFGGEVQKYAQLFGIDPSTIGEPEKEVVVFWENGLVPTKEEWSLNFTVVPGSNGMVTFVNHDLGLSFPFPLKSNQKGVGGLSFVRVAFPKYRDRLSYYSEATVSVEGREYAMERVEDLNYIARETLQDRFLREMSNSLLRLALKKAAEMAVRQESQELGAVMSIVGAVSEKADTRHWQSLPSEINYVRVPISAKTSQVKLTVSGSGSQREVILPIPDRKDRMVFADFHTVRTKTIAY